ncbi:MAG: TolC family protein [Polyangia bacterium]
MKLEKPVRIRFYARHVRTQVTFVVAVAVAVAVLAGAIGPAAVALAEANPPVRELTLDDALAAARRANRTLVAERARLEQAHAVVDRAWTALFPTLAAQGKYTRNNVEFAFAQPMTGTLVIQPINQFDVAVNATVPLLVPAAYPALRSVNMSARATEENVRAAEESVLFGVAQTFFAAGIADEVLLARQSSIQVARATVDNAKARFEGGAVTKVDVDRAQLAVLRAEQAERESQLAREQTYRALATLVQLPQPFKVRVAPSAMEDEPGVLAGGAGGGSSAGSTKAGQLPRRGGAQDNELAGALHLRPEFQALEAAAAASDAERSGYAWRWAPSLSGFGMARAFNYDNFARKSYAWAFGAQLDWVLYDGGVRDAQRRQAAAQGVETRARAEVLRESIRDDLLNGRRQVQTKRQAQQTFENAVALARETIELVRIQYEAGQATQIDLLTAQDNLVNAQLAVAQAHFDLAVADLTLRRAAGTFPAR